MRQVSHVIPHSKCTQMIVCNIDVYIETLANKLNMQVVAS